MSSSRYGINSSASKTCFVTSICAHIVRLIIQNRFHLPLKVLLHSKFIAKSTYRLLQRPRKNQVGLCWWEIAFSRKLPSNKKCMTSLQTPSDISRSSQSIKIGIDLSINKSIKVGKSDLYRSIGRNRWHARFVHRFILIFTDFIDLYRKIHLFMKKWKLDSCKQYVCWQLSCNWESKDKTILSLQKILSFLQNQD